MSYVSEIPNFALVLVVDDGFFDEAHLNRLRAADRLRTSTSEKQRKGKKAGSHSHHISHRQSTVQFCPGFDDSIPISRRLLFEHVKSHITKTMAATEALRRYKDQWAFRSGSFGLLTIFGMYDRSVSAVVLGLGPRPPLC